MKEKEYPLIRLYLLEKKMGDGLEKQYLRDLLSTPSTKAALEEEAKRLKNDALSGGYRNYKALMIFMELMEASGIFKYPENLKPEDGNEVNDGHE